MAKIKLTKNELKSQRDALKRFERYLPTLQLKKQQLQLEARRVRETLAKLRADESDCQESVDQWIRLLDEECLDQLRELVAVDEWGVGVRNIAGIDTPVFVSITFRRVPYDLFATPLWFDDVLDAVKQLVELSLRRRLVQEQLALIEQELRIVTQRVNLFEKVKIPETREHIRRIQIYLGDQETNAVGRAKIAKAKCRAREAAAPALA